ncbi:MAG: AAA family ATPase [Campylobacterota bacterium]|nr:AAA family ATPase [Campylobacterota bacterium]
MIEKIHIQNFKSIYDLEIETSRINLFIGENGSGKSNLLEALVFVSASDSNKLDNEFLVSRGIRVTEPQFMRSAFDDYNKDKNIDVKITYVKNKLKEYSFRHGNEVKLNFEALILDANKEKYLSHLNMKLENFLIYSPENTSLRVFEKEGQIQPLGLNGEGLLKLLKVINNNYEDKTYIKTIIKSLQLFNWFENIEIPSDLTLNENRIVIKDKYLYQEFDQRSAMVLT